MPDISVSMAPSRSCSVNPVQIRRVHQQAGLLADRVANRRMGMPEPAHGDARKRIEIAPAFRIPKPNALAAREGDGQAVIGGHQGIGHCGRPRCSLRKTKKAVPQQGKPPLLKGEAGEYSAKRTSATRTRRRLIFIDPETRDQLQRRTDPNRRRRIGRAEAEHQNRLMRFITPSRLIRQ
jgi:hypothetical protein